MSAVVYPSRTGSRRITNRRPGHPIECVPLHDAPAPEPKPEPKPRRRRVRKTDTAAESTVPVLGVDG